MKRIPELDGLRGIAAVAIVLYHLWFLDIVMMGTAVNLFFVLSGYLITAIILRNGHSEGFLKNFYMRRGLRIWPIYYLTLLLLVAARGWLPQPGSLAGLPYYLTYTQKLPLYWSNVEPPMIESFRHTWTLAAEEQFYLIWPFLILSVGRAWVGPLAWGLAGLAVAGRAGGFAPWLLLTSGDGFAIGGVIATMLDPERRGMWRSQRFPVAFLGTLGLAIIVGTKLAGSGQPLRPLGINLVYGSLVGGVVLATGTRLVAALRSKMLIGLGQISYGLYLYHHIVFTVIAEAGWVRSIWLDMAMLAASFALAVVSWHAIERPILTLKDRFDYQQKPRPSRPSLACGLPVEVVG